ncbi:MAG: antitoxin [Actinobacteria bacterium]|nr:antitoxin [Actinomycetota bacterium]MCL5446645.1 antitoxin [Actinomycetota bacterium]
MLPNELVDSIDEEVASEQMASGTKAKIHALERERRRKIAEQDAAIVARPRTDAVMDSLAEYIAADYQRSRYT